jgi:hypothetical protein
MRYYPLGGRLLYFWNRWHVIGGLSLVKFFATVWGFTEGKWIFREEKTIFGIPGHERNVFEDRPRDTGHDKKQSDSGDAI